jgi:hypothetical protein
MAGLQPFREAGQTLREAAQTVVTRNVRIYTAAFHGDWVAIILLIFVYCVTFGLLWLAHYGR